MVSEADSASGSSERSDRTGADAAWYLLGTSTLIVFHVLVAFIALGVGLDALPVAVTGASSPKATAVCLVALLAGSFSAYRAAVLILE